MNGFVNCKSAVVILGVAKELPGDAATSHGKVAAKSKSCLKKSEKYSQDVKEACL